MHKHWEHRILPNKHIINPAVNMTVVACGGVNVVVSACDTRMATEQPEFDVIEYQHLILAWMQVHRRLGPARDKSATRVELPGAPAASATPFSPASPSAPSVQESSTALGLEGTLR